MHKSATKCNETVGKWCKNKHGASKIIDTLETYQGIAIVDPYYMRESQLSKWEGQKVASEYLSIVMRKNIGKDLQMAYFSK
jgi:hypothetical protein